MAKPCPNCGYKGAFKHDGATVDKIMIPVPSNQVDYVKQVRALDILIENISMHAEELAKMDPYSGKFEKVELRISRLNQRALDISTRGYDRTLLDFIAAAIAERQENERLRDEFMASA